MRRSSLCTVLLLAACQREVGTVEVFLVKSPRADQDPLDPFLVARVRLRLVAPGEEVRTAEFDYQPAGGGALHDVPVGAGWVLTVEGLDASGGVRSRGRSLPFQVSAGARQLTLYLGRVGQFSLSHASPRTARAGHGAVELSDGRMLLAGGTSALDALVGPGEPIDALRSALLFDPGSASPAAEAEEDCTPGSDELCLGSARAFHGTSLLADGRVLMSGGEDRVSEEVLSSGELLDPDGRRFFAGPALGIARAQHVTLTLPSGVLVVGGRSSVAGAMDEVELLSDGTFLRLDPLAQPRRAATAVLLDDGGLVLGGLDAAGLPVDAAAERFDAGAGRFLAEARPARPRAFASASVLGDGRVLIAGGLTTPACPMGCALPATASIEAFDPQAHEFREIGTLAVPRWGHTATTLPDGTVLVVGGLGGNEFGGPVPQVERIDPSTGTAHLQYTLTEPRAFHTTTLLGTGFVYVAGGIGAEGGALSSVEVLVP